MTQPPTDPHPSSAPRANSPPWILILLPVLAMILGLAVACSNRTEPAQKPQAPQTSAEQQFSASEPDTKTLPSSQPASASQLPAKSPATDPRSSVALFDGKSLGDWQVTEFAGHGDVEVEDGTLVLGYGVDLTGVTWAGKYPTNNYEIHLDAMRKDGSDFFCGLTFPVDDAPCTLIIGGWGGTVVGLSCIDGADASENETTRYESFDSERWYDIRLRVTDAEINVWIDDEQIISVARANRTFSIRSEVDLSQPLGIASWQTTAALRNIVVRNVD